ncbi:Trypanosomal VSG domain/Trypanosome variant surface glycoprotein C-terminal domain containing protein, putative [Trypanosoma equiperdum]|uniref:Trypanosomal VSG domain/Trypanosome variant surface glycoprotein C-terminal domain containing protein, putative n=1 Tax=Trypanosoma equiperdum TaxID=5694 RepID=A0A1G4I9E6_TRYEQ|nr:Trypanosomal VSG domain/Trypanosome variant surface glycoprotein C-terminal domain containing protein, putative [Trypanosoma equiperdum]
MFTGKLDEPAAVGAIYSLAAEIDALNLSTAPAELRDKAKESKTWETLDKGEKPTDQGEQKVWKEYYNFWAASKKQIKKKRVDYDACAATKLPPHAQAKLLVLVEIVYTCTKDASLGTYSQQQPVLQKESNQALYGQDSGDGENSAEVPANRKTECGSNTAGGKKAGQSLRLDMACLCAHSAATAVTQACCADCDTSGESEWNTAALEKAKFEHIKPLCRHYEPEMRLSTRNLNRATASLLTKIGGIQGSTAKMKYVLGALNGTCGERCTGKSDANAGLCVIYKEITAGKCKAPDINWLQAAKRAAQAADAVKTAEQRLDQIRAVLSILNVSAGLLNLEQTVNAALKAPPTTQRTTTDCTSHKTNTTCSADKNCKWTSTDKSDGDFCKPKTGTENTAVGIGEGAGGEATTSEKCKRKNWEMPARRLLNANGMKKNAKIPVFL